MAEDRARRRVVRQRWIGARGRVVGEDLIEDRLVVVRVVPVGAPLLYIHPPRVDVPPAPRGRQRVRPDDRTVVVDGDMRRTG